MSDDVLVQSQSKDFYSMFTPPAKRQSAGMLLLFQWPFIEKWAGWAMWKVWMECNVMQMKSKVMREWRTTAYFFPPPTHTFITLSLIVLLLNLIGGAVETMTTVRIVHLNVASLSFPSLNTLKKITLWCRLTKTQGCFRQLPEKLERHVISMEMHLFLKDTRVCSSYVEEQRANKAALVIKTEQNQHKTNKHR